MNGIQIEHILNLLEDKSPVDRLAIRREVTAYLQANMHEAVRALTANGEITIPTKHGDIRVTEADLNLIAA